MRHVIQTICWLTIIIVLGTMMGTMMGTLMGTSGATPTNVVTDIPTNEITDIPTNEITDIPTNVVTDIPTNVVTDIPTNVVTDIPTNVVNYVSGGEYYIDNRQVITNCLDTDPVGNELLEGNLTDADGGCEIYNYTTMTNTFNSTNSWFTFDSVFEQDTVLSWDTGRITFFPGSSNEVAFIGSNGVFKAEYNCTPDEAAQSVLDAMRKAGDTVGFMVIRKGDTEAVADAIRRLQDWKNSAE